MLKIVTGIIIVSCFILPKGYSQLRHGFGELSVVETEMKRCLFDPEAAAVELINEGFADYDDRYQMVTSIHRRIKILSEKGIENADISIPFYSESEFEYIDDIEAVTINIDETGRKEFPVDKKTIYTKKVNQYYSEIKFAFPQVKAGSVIEYKYRSVKKNFSDLKNWHFQSRLPVCYSSFEMRPAPTLEFTYLVQKSENYPAVIKPSSFSNTIYFEMNNLPALADEPYMDAREDYIQKVSFTITKFMGNAGSQKYMSDWNEVARDLWDSPYFGAEIRANLKEPQQIIATAIAGKSDMEKMLFIYDFVRKNTKWNGLNSHSAVEGVRTAWNKKSGTSGSINLLLVNLMRSADLEVYPMLVSERGNGKINIKTPFVSQFDNVYAAVMINGKKYYLDATATYALANLIPRSILNTTALIVKSRSGELVTVEEPDRKYREVIYLNGYLSADGRMSAAVQTVSRDYAREEKSKNYLKGKEKYVENYIKRRLVNVTVDSLEVEDMKTDSSDFKQKFKIGYTLQNTGDYSFLELNMFSGFAENPFTVNDRFSVVNFGYKSVENISWIVKIPLTWAVDALPKNIRMTNEGKSVLFSRELAYNKETAQISARIKIELNKSLFTAEEYPALKEFFKKMAGMLNEQIVFKTK